MLSEHAGTAVAALGFKMLVMGSRSWANRLSKPEISSFKGRPAYPQPNTHHSILILPLLDPTCPEQSRRGVLVD